MQRRGAASGSAPAWQQQQQTPTRNAAAARATGLAMVTPPPRKPRSPDAGNAADAWQQQECTLIEGLEAEAARLGRIHSKQVAQAAVLRAALEAAYKEARTQHAAASAALQALASQLARLCPPPDQPQPLQLCMGPPDAYSQQCAALERALEAHIDAAAAAAGAGGGTEASRTQQQPEQQKQHDWQQAELDAVRSGLEGAIAAEAATQVEVARLGAELAALSAAAPDAARPALPLGTTAADLQRENAALQRRLAAAMDGVRQAAAAAAAGEAAAAVQAQAEGRLEGLRRRHAAKGQAVQVLQRQVARQLLAAQRRRQEAAALQAAEGAAAAAQQDAAAVLQAAQRRVERTAQRREEQRRAVAAEAAAAAAQQHAAAAAAARVSELLALRRELSELAAQLQAAVLPAQREAFAGMFAALFEEGDPSRPLLKPRPLAARLVAAEAAVAALDEAATAVLGEVLHRMQDTEQRARAERVLLQFFGGQRGELGKGAAPSAPGAAGTATAGSGV